MAPYDSSRSMRAASARSPSAIVLGPEALPRLPSLRQRRAGHERVVGEVEPAVDLERALGDVGRVERVGPPAPEVPVAVLAFVAVLVDDRHDHPEVAGLVLRPAVERAGGVVVVDEVDDVVADEVERGRVAL